MNQNIRVSLGGGAEFARDEKYDEYYLNKKAMCNAIYEYLKLSDKGSFLLVVDARTANYGKSAKERYQEEHEKVSKIMKELGSDAKVLKSTLSSSLIKAYKNTLPVMVLGGDTNVLLNAVTKKRKPLKSGKEVPSIEKIIRKAFKKSFYTGDSAGAMILGEYFYSSGGQKLVKALGILKDTIFVGHYRDRYKYTGRMQNISELLAALPKGSRLKVIAVDCLAYIDVSFNENGQILASPSSSQLVLREDKNLTTVTNPDLDGKLLKDLDK